MFKLNVMKANLILFMFCLCFTLFNCDSENLNEIESTDDDITIESESIDDLIEGQIFFMKWL